MKRGILMMGLFFLTTVVGCGSGGGVSVTLSMSQELGPEVASVSLAVFGEEVTCVWLDVDPQASLDEPECDEEREARCIHSRLDLSRSNVEGGAELYVGVGRRYVYGVAFDAAGAVIGAGCNGPLDIEEGKLTRVLMTID